MAVWQWKKGRGKLGVLAPIHGVWEAEADSPQGRYRCTRTVEPVLSGTYLKLTARWDFGEKVYEEQAMLGTDETGTLTFWSFTSDGKQSKGTLADVSDVHPEAFGFEAQVPAGLARMIYWPDAESGYRWAVESKNKKGWKRFTEHHYRPAQKA